MSPGNGRPGDYEIDRPPEEASEPRVVPAAHSVRAQLERILSSDLFSSAPALSSLLRHVVENTLDSRTDRLKEYTLGVEALDRGESFDPRTDTIVRVQVRRLRSRLKRYYEKGGRADPIVIDLPRGHYVPSFRLAEKHDEETPTPDEERTERPFALIGGRTRGTRAAMLLAAAAIFAYAVFLAVRPEADPVSGRPEIHSIAVLPLKNLSGNPQHDFFADAMTDELIMRLGKAPDLRVISRTSSMLYKDSGKPLTQIGRELGVDAVVEGSVHRSDDRVRINVRVVHAATERVLWGETFQTGMSDLLVLQDDLGHRITREFRTSAAPTTRRLGTETRPVAATALDAYVAGWQFAHAGRAALSAEENLKLYTTSIEHFERAIEAEPGFALAYASLSQVRYWMALIRQQPSDLERDIALIGTNYRAAREAADKALAVDQSLAVAHTALANILYRFEFDFDGAERAFRRAIALNPSYAEARHGYAYYLSTMGRHEEAIREIELAAELDPLTIDIRIHLGSFYLFARQYDRALEELQRVVDLPGPTPPSAHAHRAWAYMYKGMPEVAAAEWLKMGIDVTGDDPVAKKASIWIHAVSGRIDEGKSVLEELLALPDFDAESSSLIATLYAVLGENDQALTWIENWLERDYPPEYVRRNILGIYTDPRNDALHSDPRFQAILDRLGFPRRNPAAS